MTLQRLLSPTWRTGWAQPFPLHGCQPPEKPCVTWPSDKMVPTFNPSSQELQAGRSLCLMPAWSRAASATSFEQQTSCDKNIKEVNSRVRSKRPNQKSDLVLLSSMEAEPFPSLAVGKFLWVLEFRFFTGYLSSWKLGVVAQSRYSMDRNWKRDHGLFPGSWPTRSGSLPASSKTE